VDVAIWQRAGYLSKTPARRLTRGFRANVVGNSVGIRCGAKSRAIVEQTPYSLRLDVPGNDHGEESRPLEPPELGRTLRHVLENVGKSDVEHGRNAERLELSVPAEVTTSAGNVISAMDPGNQAGLELVLLHRGPLSPSEVTVRMASETREIRVSGRRRMVPSP